MTLDDTGRVLADFRDAYRLCFGALTWGRDLGAWLLTPVGRGERVAEYSRRIGRLNRASALPPTRPHHSRCGSQASAPRARASTSSGVSTYSARYSRPRLADIGGLCDHQAAVQANSRDTRSAHPAAPERAGGDDERYVGQVIPDGDPHMAIPIEIVAQERHDLIAVRPCLPEDPGTIRIELSGDQIGRRLNRRAERDQHKRAPHGAAGARGPGEAVHQTDARPSPAPRGWHACEWVGAGGEGAPRPRSGGLEGGVASD